MRRLPHFHRSRGPHPARHVLGVSRTRASHGPQALDGVDRDDVRMIQRGHRLRVALEALSVMRLYGPTGSSTAMHVAPSPDAAGVQDALERSLSESPHRRTPLRQWLYRVACHLSWVPFARATAVVWPRSAKRRSTRPTVAWPHLSTPVTGPHSADPETSLSPNAASRSAHHSISHAHARAALSCVTCSFGQRSRWAPVSAPRRSTAPCTGARDASGRLPSRRPEWPPGEDPSVAERELLKKIVDASEKADLDAFTSISATRHLSNARQPATLIAGRPFQLSEMLRALSVAFARPHTAGSRRR